VFRQLGYGVDCVWVAKWLAHGDRDGAALVSEVDGTVGAVGVVHRRPFLNEGEYRAQAFYERQGHENNARYYFRYVLSKRRCELPGSRPLG